MLGALRPNQLSVLARVIGQLAITRSPNFDDAALQINSVLSGKQGEAILTNRASSDRQMSDFYEALKREIQERQPEVHHSFARVTSAIDRVRDNPGIVLLAFAIEELSAAQTKATYGTAVE